MIFSTTSSKDKKDSIDMSNKTQAREESMAHNNKPFYQLSPIHHETINRNVISNKDSYNSRQFNSNSNSQPNYIQESIGQKHVQHENIHSPYLTPSFTTSKVNMKNSQQKQKEKIMMNQHEFDRTSMKKSCHKQLQMIQVSRRLPVRQCKVQEDKKIVQKVSKRGSLLFEYKGPKRTLSKDRFSQGLLLDLLKKEVRRVQILDDSISTIQQKKSISQSTISSCQTYNQ